MLESLLIHTVEVYRRSGRVDRFGQPVDVNPRQNTADDNLVGSYPCRAWMRSGGLTNEERSIDVYQRVFTMYTAVDVDIHEDDTVLVNDADGRSLIGRAKIKDSEVKYNAGSPHHAEFTIWEQAGPGRV